MEDSDIVELIYQRSESGIKEMKDKYKRLCSKIAYNVIGNNSDADECVNDAFFKVWNSIPPERPKSLCAYVSVICRNAAIERYRREKSRKSNYAVALEEIAEAMPSETIDIDEGISLKELLNRFILELSDEARRIFVQRYIYMSTISEISKDVGISDGAVKASLFRSREKLKKLLEEENLNF